MTNEDKRGSLIRDAARSLRIRPDDVPGDLTDKQLDAVLGLAKGTSAVKRSRGDFPIPSYKIGRTRRTPFSAVIDYKLSQLACCAITA